MTEPDPQTVNELAQEVANIALHDAVHVDQWIGAVVNSRFGNECSQVRAPLHAAVARRMAVVKLSWPDEQPQDERDADVRAVAAAQHPAGGAQSDGGELQCDSALPTAPEVSEAVSGAVVTPDLYRAFIAAMNGCYRKDAHGWFTQRCCYETGIAAVMGAIGLREEWGVSYQGSEPYGVVTRHEALIAMQALNSDGDKLVRRYVTDWEDVDG